MKRAFQKDDALLADIANARRAGDSRLWWLGQSGFLFCAGGKSILFDPYLSDSLTKKYAGTDKPHVRMTERAIEPACLTDLNVVTSSHNHTDHLDTETLHPILHANPKARLLIPRANRQFVLERLGNEFAERFLPIDAGETLECDAMRFTGIPAAHNTVEKDSEDRCKFLGYVAEVAGLTIYHSGDTMLHDGLASSLKRFRLEVVLLPINGDKPERRVAGNMDGREAAALAKEVNARLVVPHHFDMFEFNTASPELFEAECRRLSQPFRTLHVGESIAL